MTYAPIELDWIPGVVIGEFMEPVRNGGNGGDSGSPIAVLTADVVRLDRKLDDRVNKLDDRMSKLEDWVGALDVRIGKLKVRVDELIVKVHDMTTILTALAQRVVKVEADVASVRSDIGVLRSDIKDLTVGLWAARTTDFRLMFGTIIALALGITGLMAKGFGWI